MEKSPNHSFLNFLLNLFKPKEMFSREMKVIMIVSIIMAFLFWLTVMLSQSYIKNYSFKIELNNIPNNKIITSDFPQKIDFKLETTGWNLLGFNKNKTLYFDFETFKQNKTIPTFSISKTIEEEIPKDARLISTKPTFIRFDYDEKVVKKVPLIIDINTTFAENYTLFDAPKFSADSVLIAGPKTSINETPFILARSVDNKGLKDNIEINSFFYDYKGIEIITPELCIEFNPTKFIQKKIEVAIDAYSEKALPLLLLNPSRVEITFKQKWNDYSKYSKNDFVIRANFDKISLYNDDLVELEIFKHPEAITDVTISPKYSSFLIHSK